MPVTAPTWAPSGYAGGPFDPAVATLTYTNGTGSGVVAGVTISGASTWMTVSPSTANISAGASQDFTLSISTAAEALTAGSYLNVVTVTEDGAPTAPTYSYTLKVGTGFDVSIRERIARQIVRNLQTIRATNATVHRWDTRRGGLDYDHLDLVVRCQDEQGEDTDQSSIGLLTKTMSVAIGINIHQPEDDTLTTDALVNKWVAKVQDLMMADPFIYEDDTDERLAVDTYLRDVTAIDFDEGLVRPVCIFEVQYQQLRDDPYTGPGITLLTE